MAYIKHAHLNQIHFHSLMFKHLVQVHDLYGSKQKRNYKCICDQAKSEVLRTLTTRFDHWLT